MNVSKNEILTQAKLELARRDFYEFCRLLAPRFYTKDRVFLKKFCNDLQRFYESDEKILIVCMPPRHGKSFTLIHFGAWSFGKNQDEKIMTCSYNQILSRTFSKSVRGIIQEIKADKDIQIYSDVFPEVKIKYGEAAANLWSLEGAYNSYLSTSPDGTATGFGASLLIIDDLIKNYEESVNELVKEKNWEWYTNTMTSRLEQGGKTIVVMTRWASDDLAGKLLDYYREKKQPVNYITNKALQDDGSMLCDSILNKSEYLDKIAVMSKTENGAAIASANYQQIPIDLKGRLYQSFKIYKKFPRDENGAILFEGVYCYIDTADEGDDYFCAINYGVYNKQAYILDVLYTKDGMEVTEPKTAEMLVKQGVNVCVIESNNGGNGFARSIKRILREQYKSNKCIVKTFHQSKNKKARILSNATWVMENIYFPANWFDRWTEYYYAMSRYQRDGENKHDDAPDATTGIAERVYRGDNFSFN